MSGDADEVGEVDSLIPPSGGGRRRRRVASAASSASEPEEQEREIRPEREVVEKESPKPPEPAKPAEVPGLDLDAILPSPQVALRPVENTKTLGDIYAKYGVGSNPDFKVQVWRTWPKMLKGVKIDGFYDTWDQALSEEQLFADYGGGTYRIVVVGPHPQDPQQTKRYESLEVQIAGPPKEDRLPRNRQGTPEGEALAQTAHGPVPPMVVREQENPKLVEAAMKVVADVADRERQERRHAEEKAAGSMERAEKLVSPLVDAERRRADDVLKAEREKHEVERKHAEERVREAQERADREIARLQAEREMERRQIEEIQRKMEAMEMNRPSPAAEIAELMKLPQFAPKDTSGAVEATARSHEKMLESIMDKHRAEMDAVRNQHQQLIDSMRRGHEEEKTSMRESHARAIEAEREASRSREERMQMLLTQEREERRRDQERERERLEERDRSWKDRLESATTNLETQWKARLMASETTFEGRIQWLQSEIDRKLQEIAELRTKIADNLDPATQIQRMRELKEIATETFGLAKVDAAPAAPPPGGIGIGGGSGPGSIGDVIKETIAPITEGIGDNIPAIIGAFLNRNGGGAQPQQQPQQQLQPGQTFNHPQYGPMVVVRAPDGTLQGVPQAQYQAYMAAQQQAQQQGAAPAGLLAGAQQQGAAPPRRPRGPGQRPAGAPQGAPSQGAPTPKRRRPVTPNFAQGLPRPEHWDDDIGGVAPPQNAPAAQQQAPSTQRRTSRQAEQPVITAPVPVDTSSLGPAERAGAAIVAKLVHQHVSEGDEPEDFVNALLQKYPRPMLQQVVARPTELIVAAVKEAEPNGAGATPAGEAFGRRAIDLLRAAVSAG